LCITTRITDNIKYLFQYNKINMYDIKMKEYLLISVKEIKSIKIGRAIHNNSSDLELVLHTKISSKGWVREDTLV